MTKRKKTGVTSMHTHMLLSNLRALESNAVHAPSDIIDSHIARRDEWAPRYRAELDRRGVQYPKTLNDAAWERALAKAITTVSSSTEKPT